MKARLRTDAWWVALVFLLLFALGARTWSLTQVPPGLTHDEASNGHDSAAILQGVHRIYFPVGYGHEPLYNYSVAFMTLLLGQGIFTLRLTTVAWSLAQCVLTVALARRWWGRATALAVLCAYVVSFWALMLSRVGLRAPVLPVLFTAAALAYDHAITAAPRRAWPGYALAGICLGASFYTYMASRGMPLVFLLFVVAVSLAGSRISGHAHRPVGPLQVLWLGTLTTLVIALALGLPLFLYLHSHPDLEQRIGQLGSAVTALGAGDWRPLWGNIRDSLPMLLWKGDPFWLYNIAGRPGLEPVLAVAFLLGLGGALVRLSDRRHLFLLLWLAGGMAPALIAPVAYNLLHAVAAMPAVFLLAGRGLVLGLSAIQSLPLARQPAARWALAALTGVVLGLTGWEALHAYFVTWAEHRDVRVAYHHHVVALGRHLRAEDNDTPAVITSLYPGMYHDAYTMEVTLEGQSLPLKWAGGVDALFVPRQPTRLFVEPNTQPAAELWEVAAPDLVAGSILTFRQEDLVPFLQSYHWDAQASWLRLSTLLTTTVAFEDGDPQPRSLFTADDNGGLLAAVTKNTPVNFGDTVSLERYVIQPAPPVPRLLTPGSTFTLVTAWRVLAPTEKEWVIFAHLLDAEGNLLWQDDRLDAPSWQWQPEDRFVQLHRLSVPGDRAPGMVVVGLGLYARDDPDRLPIETGDDQSGEATRVLLPAGVASR